ncbi:MAG: hypothetical protein M3N98_05700, partial [Actinomycetota bacterium]|nr:hypothetical protein [Actinomycetota bacterium]
VDNLGEWVVTLKENVRQLDEGDRTRIKLIRDGQSKAAIESARAAGRWNTADTADGVRSLLLQKWRADPGVAGRDKLIIANTVAEIEWFNEAARKLLLADGTLGSQALTIHLAAPDRAVDSREFRVGDRVRANRNRPRDGVYTGRIGTITELHPQARQVVVSFDSHTDRQRRDLPATRAVLDADFLEERTTRNTFERISHVAPGLTHAYASTANAVQGRTSQNAYVLVAKAGATRATALVAWTRARLETHLFGLTVPDPDDLSPHERGDLHPDPDPNDVTELAAAMAREAHQTMALVTDPLAAHVGPLLTRPTSWLANERAAITTALGTDPPPIAEAQRQVRTALAAAYGLPLADLECHQLSDAVGVALAVPGATAPQLIGHILSRGRLEVRELDSAEDPMAVLVWAAGDYATEVLAGVARHQASTDDRPEPVKAREAQLRQQLNIVDTAIERQRAGRLALAETDPGHYLTAVLGPIPTQPAGAAAWRRAARRTVEYRDVAGLFDTDNHRPADPWTRTLRPAPDNPALRAHYDQVVGIVSDCRVTMVVAQLGAHVPPMGQRPTQAVAQLAERPLAWLEAQLTGLREVAGAAPGLKRTAEQEQRLCAELSDEIRDADARLQRAQNAVEEASAAPRQRGKAASVRAAAGDLAAAQHALAHAETTGQLQRERAESSARRLHISQVVPIERLRHLEQATEVRTGRLGAELLTHPASWMLDDIADRLAAFDCDGAAISPGLLAAGYRAVAVAADRARLDPHDLSPEQARHLAVETDSPYLADAAAGFGWDRNESVQPTIVAEQPDSYLGR